MLISDLFSNEARSELTSAVLTAHATTALRESGSTQALRLAYLGSGDYTKALIAALSTIGGKHAPLPLIYDFLMDPNIHVRTRQLLDAGMKIPGWGSSWPLPDKVWLPVERLLREQNPIVMERVDIVTADLVDKKLLPNAGCFTACAAITLGLPGHLSPFLFVAGRLPAWTNMLSTSAG